MLKLMVIRSLRSAKSVKLILIRSLRSLKKVLNLMDGSVNCLRKKWKGVRIPFTSGLTTLL